MKLIADIYRSTKKAGLYLYVANGTSLDNLPKELLQRFGRSELAMTMLLTPERKLAHAAVARVIEEIEQNGFYLQLPPLEEISEMHLVNEKMTRDPL